VLKSFGIDDDKAFAIRHRVEIRLGVVLPPRRALPM
jgi:hypothetical protein